MSAVVGGTIGESKRKKSTATTDPSIIKTVDGDHSHVFIKAFLFTLGRSVGGGIGGEGVRVLGNK